MASKRLCDLKDCKAKVAEHVLQWYRMAEDEATQLADRITGAWKTDEREIMTHYSTSFCEDLVGSQVLLKQLLGRRYRTVASASFRMNAKIVPSDSDFLETDLDYCRAVVSGYLVNSLGMTPCEPSLCVSKLYRAGWCFDRRVRTE